MAEETQPPPEPAPAPAPAPAPVPAKPSGAKKLVVPLILLVVVAAGGFGAWRYTSARAAKAAEEAAAQAAAQAEAAAKAKAKADAEAAAKAQADAAAAAKAAADDPANIRKLIEAGYERAKAARMENAANTFEPVAFEAKFGGKKISLIETSKLAALPTLSTVTYAIGKMTVTADEAEVSVRCREEYAVAGGKTQGKPVVREFDSRDIWVRTAGAWKLERSLEPIVTDPEEIRRLAVAEQKISDERVATACVNEIGIYCNAQRDDIPAARKCLKQNMDGLLAPCKSALRPSGK